MHVHAKITDNRLPSKHIPTCPHLGITRGWPRRSGSSSLQDAAQAPAQK